jgi:molecular chaperone GrpE
MRSSEDDSQGPVIRDRRRIDPVTGEVRDADRLSAEGSDSTSQHGPARHGPAQPGGERRPGRHSVPRPGAPSGDTAHAADVSARFASEPEAPGDAYPDQPGTGAGQTALEQAQAAAAEAAMKLAERTSDLQRLQAEYANYRKRVERDRLAVREQALANVLTELLPVLDDIGRAREHGELTGGFKSVADSLESAVVKLGLARYGEDGDPFDPKLHEALMHSYSPDVTEVTCVRILQPGYKVGDRILRPARVAVAEPGEPAGPGEDDDVTDGGGDDYTATDRAGGTDDVPPADDAI